MHKQTKVYHVKKGERCIRPLNKHHGFITPGKESEAETDCLIVIPHCSEQHGVVIDDAYLKDLGYFYIHAQTLQARKTVKCYVCDSSVHKDSAIYKYDFAFCCAECLEKCLAEWV